MGRIVQQRGALVQRFAHQRDIALCQIAHAAMHQFGGTRGCTLGKVVRLQQTDLEASRHGIYCSTQTGGTAANNQQIVGFWLSQACQQLGTVSGQGRRSNRHGATKLGKGAEG